VTENCLKLFEPVFSSDIGETVLNFVFTWPGSIKKNLLYAPLRGASGPSTAPLSGHKHPISGVIARPA
jgi:hypothetical protein